VLDKSGSMVAEQPGLGYWDHDANANTPKITRWNSLYQVVDTVVTKFNDKLNFGASLFPSKFAQHDYNSNACKVNAQRRDPGRPRTRTAILAGIPPALDDDAQGRDADGGGHARRARTHLKTLPADVPRAVLLVTDGAANCTMGADAAAACSRATTTTCTRSWATRSPRTRSRPTWSASTPRTRQSNRAGRQPGQHQHVHQAQRAGGPGRQAEERPGRRSSTTRPTRSSCRRPSTRSIADALSCMIPLDSEEPAKPELTKVKILGVEVHVMDCAKENGWVYTNPNGPYDAIELCGTACTNLKQSGKAEVNFFCVPN
jgi:hypothetical protein